jgi:hypothetical protein
MWYAISNWGEDCSSATNNSYKLYLTSVASHVSDGDLSNDGQLVCTKYPGDSLACWRGSLTDNTDYYWQVKADNGARSRLSAIWSFRVKLQADPWWQVEDGDVHGEVEVSSPVPSGKYLNEVGDGGSSGVVSYGSSLSSSPGSLSTTNWRANTLYGGEEMNYSFIKNRLGISSYKSLSCSGNVCDFPTESGVYLVDLPDIDLKGTSNLSEKVIIFATGSVQVTEDITVTRKTTGVAGGFFALAAQGSLTFDSSVTTAHGLFLADGTLTVEDASTAFVGQGSFIGWGGAILLRDLGEANNTTPGVKLISRPDFYLNAPREFQIINSFFQEVAP